MMRCLCLHSHVGVFFDKVAGLKSHVQAVAVNAGVLHNSLHKVGAICDEPASDEVVKILFLANF